MEEEQTEPQQQQQQQEEEATPKRDTTREEHIRKLQLLLDRTAQYSKFLASSLGKTTYGEVDAGAASSAQGTSKKRGRPAEDDTTTAAVAAAPAPAKKEPELMPQKRVLQPAIVTGGTLRSYQLDALNWLIQLFENGMNGILADQMGLGKTITTIALLAHLWCMGVRGPFLIVAPVSTLANWIGEFGKWAPSIPVVMYHGSKPERQMLRDQILQMQQRFKRQRRSKSTSPTAPTPPPLVAPELPVVITSYEIAIRDCKHLMKHHWKYLVVDEAHRLKNFECKLVCSLRMLHTESRLLLTGTPLQNSLSELWSLLNFLLPDLFDDLDSFKKWFDFTELLEGDASAGEQLHTELVDKLHDVLRPFLLRRLKQDVEIDIPKKVEVVLYAQLAPAQRLFYNAVKDKSFVHHGFSYNNLLMQLRKVCNHPLLFPHEVIRRVFQEEVDTPGIGAGEPTSPARPGSSMSPAPPSMTPVPSVMTAVSAPPARNEVDEGGDMHSRLRKRGSHVKYEEPTEDDIPGEDDEDNDEGTAIAAPKPVKASSAQPPKRPRSAWNMFCAERWAQFHLEQNAAAAAAGGAAAVAPSSVDKNLMVRMNSKFASEWAALAPAEKQRYQDRLEEELRVCAELAGGEEEAPTLEKLISTSGKMALLHKLLPGLKERGHKVLLFSQMTRMLDTIEDYVRLMEYGYARIDGSLPQAERQRQIDGFNNDPNIFIFLLSTRAGGQGINLASADTVIIYDSDWNPQQDLQAQDRCHRIGQTRPVVVYRLISANSVDSRILKRARSKLFLERLVVGKGSFSRRGATRVTAEDVRELLASRVSEEKAISDEEIEKMLDRDYVLRSFEEHAAASTAAAAANVAVSADAVSAAAAAATGAVPAGFEYIPESRAQF